METKQPRSEERTDSEWMLGTSMEGVGQNTACSWAEKKVPRYQYSTMSHRKCHE